MTICRNPLNATACRLLLALAALTAATGTQAATVALSSHVLLLAGARATASLPLTTQSNEWLPADPLAPTTLSVAAESVDLRDPTVWARAQGSITTQWTDAAHGTVDLTYGYQTSNVTNGYVKVAGQVGWTYTFQVDRDSVFRLDHDFEVLEDYHESGRANQLPNWIWRWSNPESAVQTAPFDGHGEWNLLAGETYTLTLAPFTGVEGFLGTRGASVQGHFTWSIDDAPVQPASVPEPAGLPLLALLAAGAVQVRRARRPTPV